MDLTCPLRPYERIEAVYVQGKPIAVESRDDLMIHTSGQETEVIATGGDGSRRVQMPTTAASRSQRAARILVALVVNGTLVALAIWMVQQPGHPADVPVALLVAAGAFHVTTTLARPTSLVLDVGWVFTQGIAAAAISHLSLAMPRARRVPERLPGIISFFYAMALSFAIVEALMLLRGSRLWELPDRMLGSWILFGALALSVSSYLALVESESRREQRIARLLLIGSAAFLASMALVSAGAGSAFPLGPRRTLVAVTTLLVVGLAYLASYHSPSDMPRLLRWMTSYVVYTSGVATAIYLIAMLGESSRVWPWPKLDPAFFLVTVFVCLVIVEQIRRASWGLAEIWVSPWAPRLERVQRSHALGAATLEGADCVMDHFKVAIEEGLGTERICGFLSAGVDSWRRSTAAGCNFEPGLARDALEVLNRRGADKGVATHVLQLSDVMGQDDTYISRLQSSGVVAICGLRGRDAYRGIVLIGRHPRLRILSSDHMGFLEQVALHSSLAIEKADLEQENLTSTRMAAFGHAAVGLAHDMGRPLGEILVESRVEDDLDCGGASASSLSAISDLATECLGLLGDFGKKGASATRLSGQDVELGIVIRSAVDRLMKLHSGRRVVVRVSPDQPLIRDPTNLQRVVENLVENSLQWSECEEPVEVVGSTSGKWAVIRVIDCGTGMMPEVASRAFEPFFSLRRGGGLGLTICRDIVEALEGTICIDSNYRRGTTATVKVPVRGSMECVGP
jgi:signal transduction histidine kinase